MTAPTPSRPRDSERHFAHLDALTGLRGIAAYSVLTAHAIDVSFAYSGDPVFHPFAARLAYLGMSLFFVLSGFVLHYNYAETFRRGHLATAAWTFFVARFARIYPLYAFSIVISLRYIPTPLFGGNTAAAVSYLTLTQSWLNTEMAVFPPDWSISTEWFFYLAFIPLLLLTMQIRRPVRALIVFLATAPVGLIVVFHFFKIPLQDIVHQWLWWNDKVSADPWGWIIYFSPLVRVLEFVSGMIASKAYSSLRAGTHTPAAVRAVLALSLAWCAVVLLIREISDAPLISPIASNFIYAPAITPLVLCCCLYETRLSRGLASRPLLFMGEISYSVYVWSFFVLSLPTPYFLSAAPSALAYFNSGIKMTASIILTTVFAYGSYLMIEVPSRRWIRTRASRPARPQVTEAAR